MTIDDAKEIIEEGWKMFTTIKVSKKTASSRIKLSDRFVTITCDYNKVDNGRVDCILEPPGNKLDAGEYHELNKWFSAQHKGFWVKPPDEKKDGRLYVNTGKINKFGPGVDYNLHLEVTDADWHLLTNLFFRLIQ